MTATVDRQTLDIIRSDRGRLESVLIEAGATITGTKVQCPFHQDEHASAGIIQNQGGTWLLSCRACQWNGTKGTGDIFDVVKRIHGCGFREARDLLLGTQSTKPTEGNRATRQAPPQLYDSPEAVVSAILSWPAFKDATHKKTYPYKDQDGRVIFAVARFDFPNEGKQFRAMHPVGGK